MPLTLSVTLIFAGAFARDAKPARDISGAWEFQVKTSMGSGTPKFVLKQEGEKLSGTYTGRFGTGPVTGSVMDDAVEIFVSGEPGNEHYVGKILNDHQMHGTVKLKKAFLNVNGTWDGEKKPAPPKEVGMATRRSDTTVQHP